MLPKKQTKEPGARGGGAAGLPAAAGVLCVSSSTLRLQHHILDGLSDLNPGNLNRSGSSVLANCATY
jgi:hypothetical protein